LNLATGSDFAVMTLLRYGIFAAGLVTVCRLLGLQWDDLQWLVAALSVGLGFGLQEIFANFISGLIILFEKPIRIGDIVTLSNGVTGTIDAINTRATMLTNWDNKEIIIPNKTLITEQLTNWSLSSMVIRVVVPVGIAYGSDTELVHRLLLEVANEHPLVLDKPEKVVLFRAFGPSSLDFELRCFVANPGVSLGVTHDLNMRIDKRFREQGIEIAFPQMDVHIRNAKAGG
jgi:potassium efflux system protein